MKKVLLLLLLACVVYVSLSLYFLDKRYFICPINYAGDFIIRADALGDGLFGTPRSGRRLHQGIDLLAAVGTPVFAPRAGVVIAAKNSRGMGNYIILRHSLNLISIYGHLSKIYVRRNQFVRQNDLIGAVGKTGNAGYRSMQPHLHFEIRKNGIPEDPLAYLD